MLYARISYHAHLILGYFPSKDFLQVSKFLEFGNQAHSNRSWFVHSASSNRNADLNTRKKLVDDPSPFATDWNTAYTRTSNLLNVYVDTISLIYLLCRFLETTTPSNKGLVELTHAPSLCRNTVAAAWVFPVSHCTFLLGRVGCQGPSVAYVCACRVWCQRNVGDLSLGHYYPKNPQCPYLMWSSLSYGSTVLIQTFICVTLKEKKSAVSLLRQFCALAANRDLPRTRWTTNNRDCISRLIKYPLYREGKIHARAAEGRVVAWHI